MSNVGLIKDVRSATFWLFGSSGAIQLISWVITVFVARILSPDDYGLFGMAALLTSFLVMFNELGLGPAIIQKKDLTQEQLSSCFWAIIGLNLFAYFLAFISAPLIASFFHEPRLTLIIRIASISAIIGGCYKLPYSLLAKELMFKKRSLADFISRFIGSIFTLFLAVSGYEVWSLVYGVLVSDFIKLILVFVLTGWFPEKIFSFQSIKKMVYFGYNVTGARLLWYFYSNSDYLIAGKLLGKTQLGYYTMAFQLASLPLEKFGSLVGQITLPFFSKLQDDEISLRNYFLKTVRFVAIITFPVFVGMYLVAEPAVVLILTPKWLPMVFPFKVLCLIGTLRAVNFNSNIVLAKGRPDIEFTNMIIFGTVMPVGFLIGCQYGINGLAYAWLFLYPICFIISAKRCLKVINVSLLDYFRNLTIPILAALAMIIVVTISKLSLLSCNYLTQFLCLSAIGAICYISFILVFYMNAFMEIKSFIKGS